MSNFTLGEWDYLKNGEEYVIHSEGKDIAYTLNEPDARLIASAPKMYSLLCEAKQELKAAEYIEKLLDRIDGKINVQTQE